MSATLTWKREDIVYCRCSDMRSVHSHCPCGMCNGSAVSRSTEYRHWEIATKCASNLAFTSTASPSSSLVIPEMPMCIPNVVSDDKTMSGDELEACSSEIATVANSNQSSPSTTATDCGDVETMLEAEDFCAGGIECTLQNEDGSFPIDNVERMQGTVVDHKVKCIIREAVLGAMKIQSEFSSSRAHFLRVLNYGRDLFCKGDPNIIKYWPKTWQDCISLLSGEGYTEAIQYWICLNREHPCCYDITNSPEELCKFEHKPKVTSGGPRNIALIGHWDGWQPFSTSCKHSCGAIEVSIATMKKSDRCSTEEVYVSGFVPSYLLPNKCPISLDPFLEILVKELEDLFVNELKDGRLPTSVTKRLGFWKAEELQKFCYPASEYVLGGILPDDEYHVWILIVRITEMIFQIGRSGWSDDDIQLLKQLILRHNTLTEEVEGLKSCVVTLHNLIHYPEEIKRFSSPDNYWCYTFERAVHGYVVRSSNNRNMELSFSNSECLREFLKFHSGNVQSSMKLNTSFFPGYVHASTISEAVTMAKHRDVAYQSILVGGKKYTSLSTHEVTEVFRVLKKQQLKHFTLAVIQAPSIYMSQHGFGGTLYRVGEHVLVSDDAGELSVAKIDAILAVNIEEEYHLLLKGEEYAQSVTETGDSRIHTSSENPFVESTSSMIFFPCKSIVRKVMLFPDPDHLHDPYMYVVIDHQRPFIPLNKEAVIVPHFPEAGDMVCVRGTIGNEVYFAHIQSVNKNSNTCQVYFYGNDPGHPSISASKYKRLKLQETVHWSSILGTAKGQFIGHYWVA
ncbi:hypothetical protein EMCRGX_G019802 [Ephydatia muelleri]